MHPIPHLPIQRLILPCPYPYSSTTITGPPHSFPLSSFFKSITPALPFQTPRPFPLGVDYVRFGAAQGQDKRETGEVPPRTARAIYPDYDDRREATIIARCQLAAAASATASATASACYSSSLCLPAVARRPYRVSRCCDLLA